MIDKTTCRVAFTALLCATASGQWTATETQTLLPADQEDGDRVGEDLDVDGTTAVIGAPGAGSNGNDAGAAYVFEFDGSTWVEGDKLTASDGSFGDRFGHAVAISGDTILCGAPEDDQMFLSQGSVYVNVRSGSTWLNAGKLNPSNPGTFDQFGNDVQIDGDTAVVGAVGKTTAAGSDAGAVYVFVDAGSWTEQAYLVPSDGAAGQEFGYQVAVEGDTVLVGCPKSTISGLLRAGAVYVFERTGTVWTETQKIVAGNPLLDSWFGNAVDLEGDTALVGYRWDEPGGLVRAGSTIVLERVGGTWAISAKLVPELSATEQWFGHSVSLSGGMALVGTIQGPVNGQGSADVFVKGPKGWANEIRVAKTSPVFGQSVILRGNRALVGSPYTTNTGGVDGGEVYEYQIDPDPPASYCTAGSSEIGCQGVMGASGTPSVTAASGFDLLVTGVQGGKRGLFFFGVNGKQANPWGSSSSFQCVTPPVTRTPLLQERGTEGQCDGDYAYDLNASWTAKPQQNPGLGAIVQAQFWYRDPFALNNVKTALSDAIEFTVGP